MKAGIALLVCCCVFFPALAQTLQPTVSGDSMLCPGGTGVVSTQTFDTYQWKRRYLGSTTTEVLAGQNNRTLVVDYYNFAASYVSVTVSQGNQTATSPEFFIDGYVFLPPFVIISGTIVPGPGGELMIHPGDTLTFTLGDPYNTNITWFRNGEVIQGANSQVLKVGMPGVYDVQGAPEVCPAYLQSPGVPLEVVWFPTGVYEHTGNSLKVFPNPTTGILRLTPETSVHGVNYQVFNEEGKILKSGQLAGSTIDIKQLAPGAYFLSVEGHKAIKFIKQ